MPKMTVVDLNQRSEEWLKWRALGITATDIPVFVLNSKEPLDSKLGEFLRPPATPRFTFGLLSIDLGWPIWLLFCNQTIAIRNNPIDGRRLGRLSLDPHFHLPILLFYFCYLAYHRQNDKPNCKLQQETFWTWACS